MILGSVSVFAAEDISVLKGMGIAPDSFSEAVGGEKITRGEYAYMLANLLNKDEMDPMDTRFTDVTKADYMSGQIEFLATRGVAGGYGDGTFGKDDPVSLETAYVFLVRLLGLENFVRAQEGSTSSFTHFAYTIGLKAGNYTDAEGYVTKSGASAILHDALTASLPKTEWSTEGGELILSNENRSNLLAENLGISAYDAYVEEVDMEDYTVTFQITKNKNKNNPVVLEEGTVKKFFAASSVNIYEYEKTPVSIWVDEDEKIIDMQYKKDVEVRYVNIVSINGDDAEHTYRVGSINRMTFLDDEEEYEVASGATYKLNGKNFTGQTALVGNYAKVIIQGDEITHVESWDLIEGGIITDISIEKISYVQGDKNRILKDINLYENKLFFIGDRSASYSEIKPNSVFYYYKNEENSYITLVVSELIITDILNGVSKEDVTIGNKIIDYDDYFYFKTSGTTYEKSTISKDFVDIYGKTASAHVAHNGKVLYLFPEDVSDIQGSFYGVVVGIEPDKREPELADIKLIKLNGSEITEEDYKITEKTRYKDSLSLTDLRTNARNKYGNGIYKFKVNNNGIVTQVEKPQQYFKYPTAGEGAVTTTSKFQSWQNELYFNTGKDIMGVVFLNPSIIYTINDVGGKFFVETWALSDVLGKQPAEPLKVILYGEGKSLQPGLVVLASKEGTDSIGAFGKGSTNYGVITEKSHVYHNDEVKMKLVVEGTSGKSSYYVTPSTASKYGINTMIKYTVSADYAPDQILISGSADLTGGIDTWDLKDVFTNVASGTVDYADDDGIVLDDGSARFYRKQELTILSIDMTGAKRKYGKGLPTEVVAGDRVFFYESEGIRFMVDVKY